MAELWEWEEAYILFQTAVMDEGTAEEKKKEEEEQEEVCVPPLSQTRTHASRALKPAHNKCDWNNGTSGGAAEAKET